MTARIVRHVGFVRLLGALTAAGALVLFFHAWMQTAPNEGTKFALPASAAASLRGYALQAGQSIVLIPAAAHASGAAGTNWRSDVEIHNPGTTQAAYTIALLKRDSDNNNPTTKSFTLNPGLSVRYSDILSSMFGFSGAAALKISVTSGTLLASSRTYNLMVAGNPLNLPAGATFGQFVPAFTASEATSSTEQARLIQLAHSRTSSGFRTNIGYVNTTSSTITMATDLYTASGTKLGTYNDSLPPFGYKQVDKIFEKVTTQDVADGYAIVRTTTTGGAFFAYASVIDNPTGDPTFIPAQKTSSSTPPSPTPTPTPTKTPTPGPTPSAQVNLAPYKPSGWENPLVPDYQPGTHTTSFLSSAYITYVDWAVANFGPANISTRINFELRLDGQRVYGWYTDGLQAGYYVFIEDYQIPAGSIAPGVHTLSIVADYDSQIPETNEGDNSWGKSWEWSNIVFVAPNPSAGSSPSAPPPPPMLKVAPMSHQAETPRVSSLATAGQVIFIPAAAHASGAAGTNWRSDVEIHNPGTTQAAYTIALLKRDSDNNNPTTKSFTLNPGLSVRYSDILSSMFGFSGAAALKISVTSGTLLASSRTYNLMVAGNPLNLPAGATFGQFVPAFATTDAVASTEQARLIQLAHSRTSSGFRTNIGYVNTTSSTITMATDLYTAAGTKLGTYNDSLPPFGYKQVDKIFEKVTSQDVADGYAIVRTTTTTAGTFFAYASVIDNPTGDPTFIPAQKTSSSTPPSPTPTPSPTPGTRPMGTVETANDIMSTLGTAGTAGKPTIEQVVHDLQTDGIEAVLNDVVAQKPNVASRIPNGVKLAYGSGYRTQNGDVLTGTVTGTYSNWSATATKVSGNYNLTFTNFTKNGGYATIQNVTGSATLNVSSTGKVSGDVTINGSGTSPVGTTTVSGTVHVDTAVCPKYPVSGTVTVRRGSETKTITFTQSCDGSYQFTGVGLEYAYFELRPLKCDGSAYAGYGVRIGLAAESGTLIVDPKCTSNTGLRDHRVSGTMSPTQATLNFSSWYGTHFYQGVFRGNSTNQLSYSGTATYTVKAFEDDRKTVRCSSPVYTASSSTGDVTLNRLPDSYCR